MTVINKQITSSEIISGAMHGQFKVTNRYLSLSLSFSETTLLSYIIHNQCVSSQYIIFTSNATRKLKFHLIKAEKCLICKFDYSEARQTSSLLPQSLLT